MLTSEDSKQEERLSVHRDRKRRSYRLWEELAVLTAHGGRCVYCLAHSEVKDHVIPFAMGGDDELRNLVPACESCNAFKGSRRLLAFAAAQLMHCPSAPGFPRREALVSELTSVKANYLIMVERIESALTEIGNTGRCAWFREEFSSTYFMGGHRPSVRVKAAAIRANYAEEIAVAEEAGWPPVSYPKFRLLQRSQRECSASSG